MKPPSSSLFPELDKALQFSQGYLELGMYDEAISELARLGFEYRNEPRVQLQKLFIYVESKQWEDGVKVGLKLCEGCPSFEEAYISTAFCLHELRRTVDAKKVLLSGPSVLRKNALFHYNMACYEAQLGNLDEAAVCLETAISMDKKFKKIALEDPDLKPISLRI